MLLADLNLVGGIGDGKLVELSAALVAGAVAIGGHIEAVVQLLVGHDIVEDGGSRTVERAEQHGVLAVAEVVAVEVVALGVDEVALLGGEAEEACLVEAGSREGYLVALALGGHTALAGDGVGVDITLAADGVVEDGGGLSAAVERVDIGHKGESASGEVLLGVPAEGLVGVRVGEVVHRGTHGAEVAEHAVAGVVHDILLDGSRRVVLTRVVAGDAWRGGEVVVAVALEIVAHRRTKLSLVEAVQRVGILVGKEERRLVANLLDVVHHDGMAVALDVGVKDGQLLWVVQVFATIAVGAVFGADIHLVLIRLGAVVCPHHDGLLERQALVGKDVGEVQGVAADGEHVYHHVAGLVLAGEYPAAGIEVVDLERSLTAVDDARGKVGNLEEQVVIVGLELDLVVQIAVGSQLGTLTHMLVGTHSYPLVTVAASRLLTLTVAQFGADFKVIHVGTQQIDSVAVEAFLSDGDIVDLAVAVVALVVETGAKHHASQGEQKYVCSHLSLSI